MATNTRYRATYGGATCTAYSTNGTSFTVHLDDDPGHGSMIHHRIGRAMLDDLVEAPETDAERLVALQDALDRRVYAGHEEPRMRLQLAELEARVNRQDAVITLLILVDAIAEGRLDGDRPAVAAKLAELTARTAA